MNWFLLALTSAIFSALAAILQKKILFNKDALIFSFQLVLITTLLSSFMIIDKDPFNLDSISMVILFSKTILGSLAFLNVMYGIQKIELSGALPLMAFSPGLTAVLAFLILNDSLILIEIAGLVLMILGVYVLKLSKGKNFLEPFVVIFKTKSYHHIIIALLLFSATSILDKLLLTGKRINPNIVLFYQQFFSVFVFGLIILVKGKMNSSYVKNIKWKEGFALILIVAVCTIVYRLTQYEAVKIAPVALVISVKRFSILIATIIGGKFFNEKDLLKKGIATILLLAGAYLLII